MRRGRAPCSIAGPCRGQGGHGVRGDTPSLRRRLLGSAAFPGESQPPPRVPTRSRTPLGGPVPRAMLLPRVGSPGEVGARRRAEFSSERSPCGEQASLLGDSLPWGHGSAVTSCAHAGGSWWQLGARSAAGPGAGSPQRRHRGLGEGAAGGGLWQLPDGSRGLSLPQPRPAGHGAAAGSGERLCPGTSAGRGAEPPVWVGAPTLPHWVAWAACNPAPFVPSQTWTQTTISTSRAFPPYLLPQD